MTDRLINSFVINVISYNNSKHNPYVQLTLKCVLRRFTRIGECTFCKCKLNVFLFSGIFSSY